MSPVALWVIGNAALLLAAYLLGSIPTGYLLGKWLKGIDVRTQGSGSTGATNVLRTLGKGPGIAVLLVDVLKGAAAVGLIQLTYQSNLPWLSLAPSDPAHWFSWMVVLSGLAAVLGHSKSVWLGFSGGKSVAAGLGILLALDWQVGLIAFGVALGLYRAGARRRPLRGRATSHQPTAHFGWHRTASRRIVGTGSKPHRCCRTSG